MAYWDRLCARRRRFARWPSDGTDHSENISPLFGCCTSSNKRDGAITAEEGRASLSQKTGGRRCPAPRGSSSIRCRSHIPTSRGIWGRVPVEKGRCRRGRGRKQRGEEVAEGLRPRRHAVVAAAGAVTDWTRVFVLEIVLKSSPAIRQNLPRVCAQPAPATRRCDAGGSSVGEEKEGRERQERSGRASGACHNQSSHEV